MASNTKALVTDVDTKPSPQYYNPISDAYEYLQGRNGANRVEIYGPDGNPITTTGNKLAVRATEIETLFNTLNAKDFATQTTLAAILAKIIAEPATEAKQNALNALIGEVQASPTENTVLERLKALETALAGTLTTQLSGSTLKEANIQNVTTAGTAVQLPDQTCNKVLIIAKRANTGYIYVGTSDVSSTVYGSELEAKDSIVLEVSNTNEVYIDSSVDGEGVSYFAI